MLMRTWLKAEALDRRDCPALFGNPWLDPNLTLSFAPDGTAVNGSPSQLGSLVPGQADAVRREVLRAFQAWAAVANVNVGVVADGGQPFGAVGPSLHDARFGDVRVGAVPLAADDVALALPYDLAAGTRAGDLMFNTRQAFAVGTAADYDVYSVALHEAGHVFGLPGADDPASAMYQVADRVRAGLGAADIQAIQQLYGPRRADAFEGTAGNDTQAKAARLQPNVGGGSSLITATADVTTPTDVDFYSFKADHLAGGAYLFNLTTSGYSLLVPAVDILDGKGNVVATQAGGTPGSADVALRLTGLTEGATYFARVRAADPTFAVGGYKLALRPEADSGGGSGLDDPEVGADDSAATATALERLPTLAGTRQNFFAASSLSTAADVDYFRVRAQQVGTATTGVLTVNAAAADASGLDLAVEVYDRNLVRQAAAVVTHDGGEFSVQLPAAEAGRDYFIAVRHAAGNAAVGNYTVGIDYGGALVTTQTLASGTLTAQAPAATTDLTVPQGQVLHLLLAVDATATPAAARVTVYDVAGRVVVSRLAAAGDAASGNAFLPAGTYRLLVGGGATDGGPMPPVAYAVTGLTLSDPVGPRPITQIDQTVPPPPPAPPPVVTSPPRPVTPVPPTPTTPTQPTDPNILLIPPTDSPTSPPLILRPVAPPPAKTVSVGSAGAAGSMVRSFNPNGSERFTVMPFPGYTGPLRTAEADFTGDGVADVLVGTGPGAASRVALIDGATQGTIFTLAPFEASFTGGVFVAAGDVTGDGLADLVITPDEGGGPRVRVFNGKGFAAVADFFGIDDPAFRGGARAAVGDLNADGTADVVVAAGFQGGPRVAAFDGAALATGSFVKLFGDFFAFEQTLRNGTYVAAGDLDGDGYADLVVGGGPGGGPRVVAYSGKDLLANRYTPAANFFAGDPADRNGVRVAVKSLDADGRADLVVGVGRRLIGYAGVNIAPDNSPPALFNQEVTLDLVEGVYVG